MWKYLYPVIRTRKGTKTYAWAFYTRTLPCFKELKTLFYVDGKKVVPSEYIYELVSPIALAHLIMGDGSYIKGGLVICTDSFAMEDVVLLFNVLTIKYGLDCTIRKLDSAPRIYIKVNSMDKIREIVLPYMHSSMLYKIGITV